ncbi:MAG: PhzF family phenazine biosynthesis protein [Xanthomonadales bacterium]|jgi:predicted PhzF superfamily epimerase YddE/YHI9|nr:PhzF family phenazine biosynthesis protein [Xanthomonadales bacterium]
MNIEIYQVDAFAERPFEGNPAAVCPLDAWLPDDLMQSIAAENNLSETAFFVPKGLGYAIRWFTPAAEVDLCGHATLASAWVLFNCLGFAAEEVCFSSNSGPLRVSRDRDRLVLDFPAQPPRHCATPPGIIEALGAEPVECLEYVDLLVIFDDPEIVLNAKPKMDVLARLDFRGVIISAPSGEYDFISRFFAPSVGVPEDPVTGSAHTKLAPYWAGRQGKQHLHARQVSARGGDLLCTLQGDRVLIAGHAVLFLKGEIEV